VQKRNLFSAYSKMQEFFFEVQMMQPSRSMPFLMIRNIGGIVPQFNWHESCFVVALLGQNQIGSTTGTMHSLAGQAPVLENVSR
jgi:hypothetical protein